MWLALDLSHSKGSYAFWDPASKRALLEVFLPGETSHSEALLGCLESSLATLGKSLSDVSLYLTSSGPGSFTGLRIAFSTLKAFAMVSQQPLGTLSAAEARVLTWKQENPSYKGTVHVLTPSGHGRSVQSSFVFGEKSHSLKSEEIVENTAVSLGEETLTSDTLSTASQLAQAWDESITKTLASDFPTQIALHPKYYGSSRFD